MHWQTWTTRMPWDVVLLAAALVGLGLASIARSETLAGGYGQQWMRQIAWALVCAGAMLAMTWTNYRALVRWSYAVLALAVLLLVAVFWFPAINGAQRWIRLGPVGLQPSEFAKLAVVVALARYLMYRDSYRRFTGLCWPLAIAFLPLVLVLKEPDLGTALVFLPTVFAMLFAAGARRRHLALLALVALAMLPVLWTQMSREQKSRITALAEQTGPTERPTDDGYHLHLAKQQMALGGWRGSLWRGPVVPDEAWPLVPEAHTDSIAVVLGERFGLIGWCVMLSLFAALVWRTLRIAEQTREPFGRLLATGIATLIGTQAVINTAMMVGLLPITGLALPLVSYGGSSLLANALALGLVLNVALRPGYEVTNEPFRFDD